MCLIRLCIPFACPVERVYTCRYTHQHMLTIYIYMHTHTTFTCAHAPHNVRAQTHTHMHTYTYTHTYIHTTDQSNGGPRMGATNRPMGSMPGMPDEPARGNGGEKCTCLSSPFTSGKQNKRNCSNSDKSMLCRLILCYAGHA